VLVCAPADRRMTCVIAMREGSRGRLTKARGPTMVMPMQATIEGRAHLGRRSSTRGTGGAELTGVVIGNRVTLWATTSTSSASGDNGADPNKVVEITDDIGATTLTGPVAHESFRVVAGPTYGTAYQLGRRLVTYRGARDSLGPRHTLGPSDRLRLPTLPRPTKRAWTSCTVRLRCCTVASL